jgi:hypothetical protein
MTAPGRVRIGARPHSLPPPCFRQVTDPPGPGRAAAAVGTSQPGLFERTLVEARA